MVGSNQVTGDAPAVSAVKQRKPKGAARRHDLSELFSVFERRIAELEARMTSLESFEVRK